MSIYDQIAEAASRKKNYVNTAGMRAPLSSGPRPSFQPVTRANPAPTRGPGISGSRTISAPSGAGPRLKSWQELQAAGSNAGGGDSGGSPFSVLGDIAGAGFKGALTVADVLRRGYQGAAGEVGDLTSNLPGGLGAAANVAFGNPFQLRGLQDEDGNRDQSFDPTAIWDRVTSPDAFEQGYLGHTTWEDDLPGFLRTPIGFAGDILTDPLTYATFGVGGVVKGGASSAARGALAQQVVKGAATKAGKEVSSEVVDRLAREVGSRGIGGLTDKALKRSGASIDDLVRLGVKPEFGARVGVGSKTVRVPGTQQVSQSMANVKGSIKRATGASRAGRITRELFTSAEYGENALKQKVLAGAPDAANAARGLAVLGQAKGRSWSWFDQTARTWRDMKSADGGHKLRNLSKDEAKALSLAVDAGDMSVPMVREVTDFFEKTGKSLLDDGVEFNMRQGYVPHRLSEDAIKMLNEGDTEIRMLLDDTIDKPEVFQKLRQSDESIADINAKWRQNHDYDLLETDIRVLGAQYLGEGQEAMMKAGLTGQGARDLGLVTDMGQAVDGTKVQAALDKATKVEAQALQRSVANRRQALNKATKVARESVAKVSKQLDEAKRAYNKGQEKVTRLTDNAARLETDLQSTQTALDLATAAAATARGKEKAKLGRQIAEYQRVLDDGANRLQSTQRQLASAENQFGRWTEDVRVAEEDFARYEQTFSDLMDERKALDSAPVATDAVEAQVKADKAAVARQKAADKFATAQTEWAAAETTAQWLRSDVSKVSDRLSAEMAEFDDWVERVNKTKKAGRPTDASNVALRDEQRQLMSDVREVLRTSTDPQVQEIAKLEAQALVADAARMRSQMGIGDGLGSSLLRSEFEAGIDLLSNPRFQEYIVDQTDQGMDVLKKRLGDDQQIDAAYRQAIETHRQFIDPSTRGPAFRALKTGMRGYAKAMNWWKGWALASPGFVFRNAYSGMFGMYLDDALNPQLGARFSNYLRRVQKDPEAAKAWAARKYGNEGAKKLDEAYQVAAASGWGITAQEVSTNLSGNKVKWLNPVSADMPFSYAMRHASSEVEAFLRGGHALAVLERGGGFEDALQRVEKFHFNYRDVTDFDRGAKTVMPFWTFWSRNMGLQASVYAKRPDKINRSYINFKRNVEESSGEDEGLGVPDYITGAMAGVLTPFGSATGRGRLYATLDLPSARFPNQVQELLTDPFAEIGSSMAPGLKIPAELAMNKDMFLGREYRNDLTSYDSTGEVPREAPIWGQIPGVSQALEALPGTERIGGRLLMQDNVEAAISNLNPTLGRGAKLFPHTERNEETFRQYWLNFLGAPMRWNDPGAQAGAVATQQRDAQAASDKVWERIRLENLVSDGSGR